MGGARRVGIAQVVSMDKECRVLVWALVLVRDREDLHLAFDGRIKLTSTGTVLVHKERVPNVLDSRYSLRPSVPR